MAKTFINLAVVCSTLLAAILLGKQFLFEVRRANATRAPWYSPYLTPAGLLVLAALAAPIIYWLITR
jgi:hypothetical protein